MDQRPEADAKAFDERAALEELEQFRREIERYQAVRQEVTNEFDRFLQSFKRPERPAPAVAPPPPAQILVETPRVAPPVAPQIVPPAAPRVAPPATAHSVPPVAPHVAPPVAPPIVPTVAPPIAQPVVQTPPPAKVPVAPAPSQPPPAFEAFKAPTKDVDIDSRPDDPFESFALDEGFDGLAPPLEAVPPAIITAPPTPPPPRQSQTTTWVVAGSVIAVLAVGGYAWSMRGAREETANAAQPVPTPLPAPAPPAPQPAAPAATPAPSPFESELVTTDPAWVRIIADGQKTLERELPAGTRIPFKAEKTIQIRTGNASAVRLIIGGVDKGPLGREGEVITRTFTVPR